MARGPLHILLTGAASGLGRGLALYFAGKGHRLVLVDRNRDSLRETVGLLGVAAERASVQVLDVTDARQVRDLVSSLGSQPVELLINDAGLQHVARLEDFPEERWDVLVDVMLKGPFLLAQAVLPSMRTAGFGRIVNIGSIHSLVASPFKSAYVAAKHGLLGLVRCQCDNTCCRVGAERVTINGTFLHSPLRTRRATFTAPGSPSVARSQFYACDSRCRVTRGSLADSRPLAVCSDCTV
jgi:NAD(P)-dependent dehydrogenase (short-subunit alcohol dehydrogenase family)